MLLSLSIVFVLSAVTLSHSTHHEEQNLSQERLAELERKWGTDVSLESAKLPIRLMSDSGASQASLLTRIFHTRAV
jgi:hypothetical protein